MDMLNIERALQSPRALQALTGVSQASFEQLERRFAAVVSAQRAKRRSKRASGAGRKHTLGTLRAKLFFILLYLKCYPTFDVAGLLFEVDRSRACRWVGEWLPLLEVVLGQAAVLPARQLRSVAEFLQRFPEVHDLFLDGTERPTQRPQQAAQQRARYSGKKKRHTVKNVIGNDVTKRIVLLGETQGGRVHDYPLLQGSGWLPQLPEGLRLWVDRGFQGLEQAAPQLKVFQPAKKPRGESLPQWARGLNRLVAKVRVRAEHAIAGVKRLRCLTDVYRNRRTTMEDHLMVVGCGLWNLQLQQA
jgi:DDE superfamily endonuclease/Helix-turn-helix of DDE superfamily endonuclease